MFNLVWYATGATGWPIPLKVVFFKGCNFVQFSQILWISLSFLKIKIANLTVEPCGSVV